MHELAISRAILEQAVGHAGGRRVRRVCITVGALRQVVPDSLEFYFGILARETLCEGAELRAHAVPARLRCGCGAEWELGEPSFRCPDCGAGDAAIVGGEELRVDSIEVEEAECTARR
jgi:hydrogenase nickel incorporation protein HypA/HybF